MQAREPSPVQLKPDPNGSKPKRRKPPKGSEGPTEGDATNVRLDALAAGLEDMKAKQSASDDRIEGLDKKVGEQSQTINDQQRALDAHDKKTADQDREIARLREQNEAQALIDSALAMPPTIADALRIALRMAVGTFFGFASGALGNAFSALLKTEKPIAAGLRSALGSLATTGIDEGRFAGPARAPRMSPFAAAALAFALTAGCARDRAPNPFSEALLRVGDLPTPSQRTVAFHLFSSAYPDPKATIGTNLRSSILDEPEPSLRSSLLRYTIALQSASTELGEVLGDRLRWEPTDAIRSEARAAACGSADELASQVGRCTDLRDCEALVHCLPFAGPRAIELVRQWSARADSQWRRVAADVVCALAQRSDPFIEPRHMPTPDLGPWLADALAVLAADPDRTTRSECFKAIAARSLLASGVDDLSHCGAR